MISIVDYDSYLMEFIDRKNISIFLGSKFLGCKIFYKKFLTLGHNLNDAEWPTPL